MEILDKLEFCKNSPDQKLFEKIEESIKVLLKSIEEFK